MCVRAVTDTMCVREVRPRTERTPRRDRNGHTTDTQRTHNGHTSDTRVVGHRSGPHVAYAMAVVHTAAAYAMSAHRTPHTSAPVSYTHLRAHETEADL
eukprot:3568728-Rhodomonas_salina.1